MLDPIIEFFESVFRAIGRGFGYVIAWICWPFVAAGRWYAHRGWIIKSVVGVLLLALVGFYGYFMVQTQLWQNFDPDYAEAYSLASRGSSEADATAVADNEGNPADSCARSVIVDATSDLIDFNVNQNAWISSMLLYKLGLFGLDWDKTPFFDNKASFQRGVNQAIRRTTVELVDSIGRVRGTSQIDENLQSARGNMQFDEYAWYFGLSPFGPKTPTPSFHRAAIRDLQRFNERLVACQAILDTRADNLVQFVDRVANDIGATSAILRERSENFDAGWFDPRADDRFWFAYGQLYGYYGILKAVGTDFDTIITQRGIGTLFATLDEQFRAALRIQPLIISNGNEAGLIMPSHLATMGFYVLRVRSNLVEIRSVLDR